MIDVSFTVLGKPQPKGSKRAFAIRKGGVLTGKAAVVDANSNAASWMQEVRSAARDAMLAACEEDRFYPLIEGPLSVTVTFYRARPAGHYGTGRNASSLKASAPLLPVTKPDVDKLSRAVLDALTGVVYRDDAQIVDKDVHKRFGVPERCEVIVRSRVFSGRWPQPEEAA